MKNETKTTIRITKKTLKEPEQKVPKDLQKALTVKAEVTAKWNDLTPTARRDFITWIQVAKQPETRTRRIEKAGSMLLSGKRRPCCYAVVPMNFYKALGGTPKAKTVWKDLTSMEKRDFVAWVEKAKDKEEYGNRIMEACVKLASGKRYP